MTYIKQQQFFSVTSTAVNIKVCIISTTLDVTERMFAVSYVSIIMSLKRCYKTSFFTLITYSVEINRFLSFWATVCTTVYPILSDRCHVCLSSLSRLKHWCTVAKRLNGLR